MSRRAEVAALASAVLIAAVALLATQPRNVFWGPDSANHFIQTQSFLRTGSLPIEHRWPLGHHFLLVGGKSYSYWSPVFPIAAAPFVALFGTAGLFVLPVAGTLLLVLLLPHLARGSILPLGIVMVFGTPVLWYTIVFWEHTLAAALAIAAFVLADRERPLVAGLLAGCSTLLREEGYIAIAAIAVALAIVHRSARRPALFVAAALVPLVPLWIFNFRLFGNPLGLHAAVYSSIATGNRLQNLFPFLFEFSSAWPANLLLAAPAIVLIVLSPFSMRDSARAIVFAAATLGFVVLTAEVLSSRSPVHDTLFLQGLFPAVPFSIAIFLSLRKLWSEHRFALMTVLTAVVLTTLSLNVADFGEIWGPRHFLWLMPLIVVLAAESTAQFSASPVAIAGALALLICSFAIQTHGIAALREKLRFSEAVLQAVRRDPAPVVLTDVFWIPEDLASTFYEKQIGFVSSDADLGNALREVGKQPILFIAARHYRLVSNRGFSGMMPRVVRRERIAGADPTLDVMLLDVR